MADWVLPSFSCRGDGRVGYLFFLCCSKGIWEDSHCPWGETPNWGKIPGLWKDLGLILILSTGCSCARHRAPCCC